MKARWGWKGPPRDFRKYFPEIVAMCLRQCTKQDFGEDRATWEQWIIKNFGQNAPADVGKLRQ